MIYGTVTNGNLSATAGVQRDNTCFTQDLLQRLRWSAYWLDDPWSRYAYPDVHTYGDGDSYCNGDTYRNSHCNSYCDCHGDFHSHFHPNYDSTTNSDIYAYGYSDAYTQANAYAQTAQRRGRVLHRRLVRSLFMKTKRTARSDFFNLRVLIGLFIVVAGVCLALAGLGAFSALTASMAQAQQKNKIITNSKDPLVPNGFDCSKIHELGIDKQMNFRAGAIMIACGQAQGGGTRPSSSLSALTQFIRKLFSPLAYGGTDVDLITGTETFPDVNQSTTFSWGNPDNPDQIVVAYFDSRGAHANPINGSGASVSTDGGLTFTRLTTANGQSPFPNTGGDPVVIYNRPTGTWYTVWEDAACGYGLGGYKSTTPWDPSPASWIHYGCVHSSSGGSDERASGWSDMNPSSPFYGRMYVSWGDFARGGNIFVRYSTDNGNTWTNERQITTTFIRNVQITGDLVTGDVYIAGMDEGGGCTSGCGSNRSNKIYRSTDGGNTWTNSYTGPAFVGACRSERWATSAVCTPAPCPVTGDTWAGASQPPITMSFTTFMPRATPAPATPATSSTSAPLIAG